MKYGEWMKLRDRALAIAGPDAEEAWRNGVRVFRERSMADPGSKHGISEEYSIAWQLRVMESNPLLLEGLMLARLEGQ